MNTKLIQITNNDTNLIFDKPGKFVVFFNNISGTISCTILSEKVELYMIGLYDMKKKDQYSVHTEQIHVFPRSFSDLLLVSTLQDNSALSFSGLIRIEKNAYYSHAYQKNKNLILSKNVFVDSCPKLEIQAKDVYCTHGSTSGPLSEEQLTYLHMRGLKKNEARKIAIEGFKQQVYDRLSSLGISI